jgi:hypothetical protein
LIHFEVVVNGRSLVYAAVDKLHTRHARLARTPGQAARRGRNYCEIAVSAGRCGRGYARARSMW